MAQLTLQQRSQIANSQSFQVRLKAAINIVARYWASFPPANVGDYNLSVQKKKRFAKNIQAGGHVPLQAYAEFILSGYNEEEPDLDDDGLLSDEVISDSSYSAQAFDHFAGVGPTDDQEPIEW